MLTLACGTIDLPLRPTADGDEWTFPPPDAGAPWQTRSLRAPGHVWRIKRDLIADDLQLVIEDDFGMVEDCNHGGIIGSVAREVWTIRPDDPPAARGRCHWAEETGRGDLQLRTEAFCEMWPDATRFHLTARLQAFENDRLIHDRDLTDSIPRDNL